ncbi:MAG TPA: HemK/PrmC family methyltransferase [Actinomycetota bacterium]|nr:HemK/PrmC family methyltransferase [Actinomycetota bacterium]
MAEPETVRDLVAEGEARLRRSPAIDHWPSQRERWESDQLMAHALGIDDDAADPDLAVGTAERRRFRDLIRRRAGGEPMAHIVGWTRFRGIRLEVRPGAFVPRQSSEWLAEQAVRRLRRRSEPVAVDLATGIGPVALAVAWNVRRARVHGTDLSADAIRQARRNARLLRLSNVDFHRGDMFASLPRAVHGDVDVITIHPPYVPKNEIEDLPLEVRGFEPVDTLTDHSEHGLGLAERAAVDGREWLKRGGWLLVEVSPDRARGIRSLLSRTGYRDVRSTDGWPNVPRVVVGRSERRRSP